MIVNRKELNFWERLYLPAIIGGFKVTLRHFFKKKVTKDSFEPQSEEQLPNSTKVYVADVLNVHRSHGWKHTADGSPLSIFPRALAVAMSSTSELMSDQRNVFLRDATQADPCGAVAVCHG